MRIDALARSLGKGAMATKLAIRSFTDIDTNPVPKEWTHITKIDPEDEKKLPLLYPLYLQHTSAISVGGSSDVNSTNTEETFELLDFVDVPVFHEPSAARHVTERTREYSEFLAIPEVLNGDSTSLIGTLGEGTTYLRSEMVPQILDSKLSWLPSAWKERLADFVTSWLLQSAVFEAYLIQNVDSAAAREANVTENDLLIPEEAAQRALAAEKHLESPVIYLEYSGTYGGDEATRLLAAIREEISWSRIWYGGGIASREHATAVLDAGADTVIVGNIFHKIATEERELFERASEELDTGALIKDVATWISGEIEIKESNAYKYLSTTPGHEDREKLVCNYLAMSLTLHLLLSEFRTESAVGPAGSREFDTEFQHRLRMSSHGAQIPTELLALLQAHLDITSSGDSAPSLLKHLTGLESPVS